MPDDPKNSPPSEVALALYEDENPTDVFIAACVVATSRAWLLANRILHCRASAEDAYQNAIIGFMQRVRAGAVIPNPVGFINQSVVNRALTMHARRETARKRTADVPIETARDSAPTPEDLAYYRELRDILKELDPETLELLVEHGVDRVSARALAEKQDRSAAALRAKYYRARVLLRRKLAPNHVPRRKTRRKPEPKVGNKKSAH